MASAAVHDAVTTQAWTAPAPARLRSPAGSADSVSVVAVPPRRTKLALSAWPIRLPTGRVPSGTPVLANGVPASRLAQAFAATVRGVTAVASADGEAGASPADVSDAAEAADDDGAAERLAAGPAAAGVGASAAGEPLATRPGW